MRKNPIKSKSQWRRLHAMEKRGELSPESLRKFKRKTKTPYADLPERLRSNPPRRLLIEVDIDDDIDLSDPYVIRTVRETLRDLVGDGSGPVGRLWDAQAFWPELLSQAQSFMVAEEEEGEEDVILEAGLLADMVLTLFGLSAEDVREQIRSAIERGDDPRDVPLGEDF